MPTKAPSRLASRGAAAACLWALLSGVFGAVPAARAYPPATVHEFDSVALINVTLPGFGLDNVPLTVVGPTRVRLGDPYDPGDGLIKINTEIESMVLQGDSPLGPVIVRVMTPGVGCIQQKTAGVDFPANSWFDVMMEISIITPNGVTTVFSDPERKIRMTAMIDALPPLDSTYAPQGDFVGVDIVDSAGNVIGVLSHAGHTVGQQPSFSVAPGGPSGLEPADLFKRQTAPVIRAAGLGLGAGDDIDALSYGIDFVFPAFVDPPTQKVVASLMDIRFSVDDGARGRAGSHVRRESDKSEPTADEFKVGPIFAGFGGGSNIQVIDESGDTAPPFPLQPADNVDALAEQPPDFADADSDGTPDRDVYFSLAAGSPALGANSAADILVSRDGGLPEVYLTAEELGLDPEADDIDAICVNAGLRAAVFSLTGSSDLSIFFQGQAFPWASAANLGLESSDDLNALKCHVGIAEAFWEGSFSGNIYLGDSDEVEIEISLEEIESELTVGAGMGPYRTGIIGKLESKDPGDLAMTLHALGGIPVAFIDEDGVSIAVSFEFEIVPGFILVTEPIVLSDEDADLLALADLILGLPSPDRDQTLQRVQLFNPDGTPSPFTLGEISFRFDGRPQPSFTAEGFRDAAGFGERPSPGGLASLFGETPTGRAAAAAIPLPRRDGDNVEVLFETAQSAASVQKEGVAKSQGAAAMIPAPLLFVDPTQINVQIPWEVDATSGSVTAVIRANGVDSDPVQLQIAPTSPGVFTTQFGAGPAIAINGDGTLAQPDGSIGASHPAAVGETIVLLVSGLGETVPPGVTGADSFDENGAFVRRDTAQPVRVEIGGVEATVVFAGLSPQFVGVFQINVTVPAGVTPGDAVSLLVEVGGRSSRDDVTIAVSPAP